MAPWEIQDKIHKIICHSFQNGLLGSINYIIAKLVITNKHLIGYYSLLTLVKVYYVSVTVTVLI